MSWRKSWMRLFAEFEAIPKMMDGPSAMETKKERIGYCGLYCGCCIIYRAYHDRNLGLFEEAPVHFRHRFDLENASQEQIACNGCRSPKPFAYCDTCQIRRCAQAKQLEWCFECEDFPCQRLYQFESFWRMPLIGNLHLIRKLGVDKWMARQEKEWICDSCGNRLHWFSFGICPRCGHSNPDPGSG